jgi:hypothetical protein
MQNSLNIGKLVAEAAARALPALVERRGLGVAEGAA